jgi:hypothetical protein
MKELNGGHLPQWKDVYSKFAFAILIPILCYWIFDASGLTVKLMTSVPENWDNLKSFTHLVFHSGMTHLSACLVVDLIYHAVKDAFCLIFHVHKRCNHGH